MLHIDQRVKAIMNLFKNNGYKIYIVGGFVRDFYLGHPSNDYDLATSAPPLVMLELLKDFNLKTNAIKYGNIHFTVNELQIAITTFRIEGNYLNHRQPDVITFTSDVLDDAKRRDFTINALYHDGSHLLDPYHGLQDLHQETIKTIGDPTISFTNDFLRMYRALRFACELGFHFDGETQQALMKQLPSAKTLDGSQIYKEFHKMVLCMDYYLLKSVGFFEMYGLELIHNPTQEHFEDPIKALAQFCRNVHQESSILTTFGYGKKVIHQVQEYLND